MYVVYYGTGTTDYNGNFYGHRWEAEELTAIANGDYGERLTANQVQEMCDDINAHGGHNGFRTWFSKV